MQFVAGHSDVRVRMLATVAEAQVLRELRRTSECSATTTCMSWPDIPMSGSGCWATVAESQVLRELRRTSESSATTSDRVTRH